MKHKILFGDIQFIGDVAEIRSIDRVLELEEDQAEEIMVNEGFGGYLIPELYAGKIIYK